MVEEEEGDEKWEADVEEPEVDLNIELQGLFQAQLAVAENIVHVIQEAVHATGDALQHPSVKSRVYAKQAVQEVANAANEMVSLSKTRLAPSQLDTDEPAEFNQLICWAYAIS